MKRGFFKKPDLTHIGIQTIPVEEFVQKHISQLEAEVRIMANRITSLSGKCKMAEMKEKDYVSSINSLVNDL